MKKYIFYPLVFLFAAAAILAASMVYSKVMLASPDSLLATEGIVDSSTIPHLKTPQRVRPPRMNAYYEFAGERVPIEDGDIRARLDRELLTNTFYHSSTQHILKHKSKYFPIIEDILREEGVPEDLKYIAVAESAFRDFRSPAGAAGVWHFMKGTGKEHGLEINGEVDERYHLEKSTRAAARFLRQLHNRFGNWTLAAAAYNRGAGGINNKMKQQLGDSFYDLVLNAETARYVFRIVALKTILEDPESFGFYLTNADRYFPSSDYREVTISKSIPSWAKFAQENGVSYRELKVLNPWLRDSKLTVSAGNSYIIRMPNRSLNN